MLREEGKRKAFSIDCGSVIVSAQLKEEQVCQDERRALLKAGDDLRCSEMTGDA